MEICERCDGEGGARGKCPICDGAGFVTDRTQEIKKELFDLRISAVDKNKKIKVYKKSRNAKNRAKKIKPKAKTVRVFNDSLRCQLIELGITKPKANVTKEDESKNKKMLLNKLPIVERNKVYNLLSNGSLKIEEISTSSIERLLSNIKNGMPCFPKNNLWKRNETAPSKIYGNSISERAKEQGLDGSIGYGQSCRDGNGSFGSLPSYDDYE